MVVVPGLQQPSGDGRMGRTCGGAVIIQLGRSGDGRDACMHEWVDVFDLDGVKKVK